MLQSPIRGRYCYFARFEEGNMETQKIKAFAQGQSNFKISSKAGIELGSLIPESALLSPSENSTQKQMCSSQSMLKTWFYWNTVTWVWKSMKFHQNKVLWDPKGPIFPPRFFQQVLKNSPKLPPVGRSTFMENWDLVNLEISGNRNDSFSVIPTNSGGRNKPLGDFLVVSKTGNGT